MKGMVFTMIGGITLLVIGFLLGQQYQTPSAEIIVPTEVETASSTTPRFMTIDTCEEGNIAFCFGSGRTVFAETSQTSIYNLVSTSDMLRYGIIDKQTSQLYLLTIE